MVLHFVDWALLVLHKKSKCLKIPENPEAHTNYKTTTVALVISPANLQINPYLSKRIPELSPHSPMKILLDPGHGLNTPGKRSPDGTFLEAAYNREIAQLTLAQLQANGHDA